MRAFVLSLTLACCSALPAWAEVPRVVTDIVPVHSLTARVMAGVGAPDLLLRPGASPHGYALRPSEAAALERADVVFWVGPELTPWLDAPLDTLAGNASSVALLDVEGTIRFEYRDAEAGMAEHHDGDAHDDHGDQDDHAHDGHDDHAEDAHDHEGADPHAWLDPENGKFWLSVIADALAKADPDNAEAYRANAVAGAEEIDRVTREIVDTLSSVAETPYAVFHDGYRYFEERFGVAPVFAIATGDAVAPGPARLAALREAARDSGVTCIFSEPQFDARLIATVSEGMEVRVATLDPLGSTLEPGPTLYTDLLVAMAESMVACADIE